MSCRTGSAPARAELADEASRYAPRVPDRWEEGFEGWAADDAPSGAGRHDVDRDEVFRLARELAARREDERADALAEVEQLKRELRDRVTLVAARERELERRERELGTG